MRCLWLARNGSPAQTDECAKGIGLIRARAKRAKHLVLTSYASLMALISEEALSVGGTAESDTAESNSTESVRRRNN